MMDRNLNRRVETLVQIVDPNHLSYLDVLLSNVFSEKYNAWSLMRNGNWDYKEFDDAGLARKNIQEHYMREICG